MAQSWSYETWNGGTAFDGSAATAPVNARAAFIRKTYLTLGAALLAFVALTGGLIYSGVGEQIVNTLFSSRGALLALMVLFVVGGMGAQALAQSRSSTTLQVLGLTGYIVLQALIFMPILVVAETFPQYAGKHLAAQAGLCTLLVFGALTFTVVATGKDFSFLRPFLMVASFAAIGLILVAILFGGVSLGLWFTAAMLVLAAGYILYDTSNVMHHYPPTAHVAAALALFSSVTLLFYYMLRLFMSQSNRD